MRTFFILQLLWAVIGFSQDFQWAKQGGGPGDDQGSSLASDNLGFKYLLGNFMGSATFGDTALVASLKNKELFLNKYSETGDVVWCRKIASSTKILSPGRIQTDDFANIYVIGSFYDSLYMDGVLYKVSGYADAFILKMDSSGNRQWVKFINGSGDEYLNAIHITESNDLMVMGNYRGIGKFNTKTTLTSIKSNASTSYSSDIFIAFYDKLGDLKNVVSKGGNVNETPVDMAVNDSVIVIASNSRPVVDANGTSVLDTIVMNVSGSGGLGGFLRQYFIAAFDKVTLKAKWANVRSSYQVMNRIDMSSEGYIYVAGEGSALNESDAFIGKYDKKGKMIWEKRIGANNSSLDRAMSVIADKEGNVYYIGYSSTSLSFDKTDLIRPSIFIVKYNAAGKVIKAIGAYHSGGLGFPYDAIMDTNGSLYITGTLGSDTDFGNITLSPQSYDMFLAKTNTFIGSVTHISDVSQGAAFRSINIFPNPTEGNIEFTSFVDIKSLVCFDIAGKTVPNLIWRDRHIDVSGLQKGFYFLNFMTENGSYIHKIQVK